MSMSDHGRVGTRAFVVRGLHQTVECVKCHPAETRAFPGGTGTAKRLKPTPTECRACHTDPHMGQVSAETHLDQQALNGLAQLEYRLRAFGFSLEYRLYGQDLRYQQLLEPFTFRGHQLMLRISRKFGLSW